MKGPRKARFRLALNANMISSHLTRPSADLEQEEGLYNSQHRIETHQQLETVRMVGLLHPVVTYAWPQGIGIDAWQQRGRRWRMVLLWGDRSGNTSERGGHADLARWETSKIPGE